MEIQHVQDNLKKIHPRKQAQEMVPPNEVSSYRLLAKLTEEMASRLSVVAGHELSQFLLDALSLSLPTEG